jgi:IclR family pca regulon transcriptional regulator
MGRVLLAALPENQWTCYIDRVERKPFTPKTIVAREAFAEELRRVRTEGYAVIDEELELGLRSIGVPIFSQQGRVAAAMSIGTQSSRISVREMQDRFLPILREHARMVGQFAA